MRSSRRAGLGIVHPHVLRNAFVHAVEHALTAGEQDDGKVLYLGPDRAGNLLEIVAVVREGESEVVIHAMRMRPRYEPFLRGKGDADA
jgi:hypothetical protein